MVLNTRMLPFTLSTLIVLCATACNASSVDSDTETIIPDEIDAEDQTVEDVSEMSERPIETERTPSGPSHSYVEKLYQCVICNKQFRSRRALSNHVRSHGPAPFSCNKCFKTFTQKGSMEEHIRGTHPEPGVNKITCSVCGKKFYTKMQHDKHKKVHGDKTHECPEPNCDRRFVYKYHLNEHVRNVHERSKRVPCSICKTWLATKGAYNTHMNTVHSGKRNVCEQFPKTFTQNGKLESYVERWHPQSSTANTARSTVQHTCTAPTEGSPQANLADCDTKEFVLRPATQSQAASDPMQVDFKPPDLTITTTRASTNAISDAVQNIKEEETETPATDLAPGQFDVADHDTKDGDFVQEPPSTIVEITQPVPGAIEEELKPPLTINLPSPVREAIHDSVQINKEETGT